DTGNRADGAISAAEQRHAIAMAVAKAAAAEAAVARVGLEREKGAALF
ncbi:hypothetical protein CCACVL1_17529, partial [Corchorus capsularis]